VTGGTVEWICDRLARHDSKVPPNWRNRHLPVGQALRGRGLHLE